MSELTTETAARMCPNCGGDTVVYSTRDLEDGITIRRRRCVVCKTKFETVEIFRRIIKNNQKNYRSSKYSRF